MKAVGVQSPRFGAAGVLVCLSLAAGCGSPHSGSDSGRTGDASSATTGGDAAGATTAGFSGGADPATDSGGVDAATDSGGAHDGTLPASSAGGCRDTANQCQHFTGAQYTPAQIMDACKFGIYLEDGCPTANIAATCEVTGNKVLVYYDGHANLDGVESNCADIGGTWSTP